MGKRNVAYLGASFFNPSSVRLFACLVCTNLDAYSFNFPLIDLSIQLHALVACSGSEWGRQTWVWRADCKNLHPTRLCFSIT